MAQEASMDSRNNQVDQKERRISDRNSMTQSVEVRFPEEPATGPGQNLSEDGVLFVTQESLRVRVRIGDEQWVDGELIRVQNMGEGRIGVAVKFV